mmetsp:Transcript_10614/g.23559  ORF Transcript_10614/g.23559 Transcript_10614/m.23559 type:complete len:318 (-) Transcript_10614:109-1062(-)
MHENPAFGLLHPADEVDDGGPVFGDVFVLVVLDRHALVDVGRGELVGLVPGDVQYVRYAQLVEQLLVVGHLLAADEQPGQDDAILPVLGAHPAHLEAQRQLAQIPRSHVLVELAHVPRSQQLPLLDVQQLRREVLVHHDVLVVTFSFAAAVAHERLPPRPQKLLGDIRVHRDLLVQSRVDGSPVFFVEQCCREQLSSAQGLLLVALTQRLSLGGYLGLSSLSNCPLLLLHHALLHRRMMHHPILLFVRRYHNLDSFYLRVGGQEDGGIVRDLGQVGVGVDLHGLDLLPHRQTRVGLCHTELRLNRSRSVLDSHDGHG